MKRDGRRSSEDEKRDFYLVDNGCAKIDFAFPQFAYSTDTHLRIDFIANQAVNPSE